MTLLLHRYRPFTVAALASLARADAVERRCAGYVADLIWKIAQTLAGRNFSLETPGEYALRLEGRGARPDERTGREILSDLMAKLEGE